MISFTLCVSGHITWKTIWSLLLVYQQIQSAGVLPSALVNSLH